MKIFLIGFMGSGKNYWGKKWATISGLQFFDIDNMVEIEQGISIADIFTNKGEDFFRDQETLILRKLNLSDNFIAACGGGTPCYNDNISWMNKNGISIYLQSSPEKIFERLTSETDKRPLIKNLQDEELIFYITEKIKERESFYNLANIIFHVDNFDASFLPDIFKKQ